MSNRQKNGSHSVSHQRAVVEQGDPAHAHVAGEDHLSGHERSQQAMEHSHQTFEQEQEAKSAHDRRAALAHALWVANGCPEGSEMEDWLRAGEQLRSAGAAG